MFRRLLFVLCVAMAATPAVAADLTLDQVLSRYYEANGGLEKMKKVETRRMAGKMTMGHGMEAPFVMEFARPNQVRMEFTVQGMTGIQAYDGKTAWMLMPFMGKTTAEEMPAEDSKGFREMADFDGPLVDWKEKGHKVELQGKEPVEGTDAYKLLLTTKDGSVRTIWIDAEAFLELKSAGKRMMRGTEIEFENLSGDYKEVDGLMVAHSMSQAAKGMPGKQEFLLEKVEMNPKLDLTRFTMPAAAAAPDSAATKPAAKDEKKAEPAKKDDAKTADAAKKPGGR